MPVFVLVAASAAEYLQHLFAIHSNHGVVGGALAARAVIVNVVTQTHKCISHYLVFDVGGYPLNSLATALSRVLMFLLELSEMVSVAEPRHSNFFCFASEISTTNVPSFVTQVL